MQAERPVVEGIRNPMCLVNAYLRQRGLLGHREHDEIVSDAMYGIAQAVATWREDGGRTLVSWCWLKMSTYIDHGLVSRNYHQRHVTPVEEVADLWWLRPHLTDPGYKQVEDRMLLQRLADMAHLTDTQSDLLAWMSVHAGTVVRHTHLAGDPAMTQMDTSGARSAMRGGLSRLRRVAATGRPFVHTPGVPAPSWTMDQVRAACNG